MGFHKTTRKKIVLCLAFCALQNVSNVLYYIIVFVCCICAGCGIISGEKYFFAFKMGSLLFVTRQGLVSGKVRLYLFSD